MNIDMKWINNTDHQGDSPDRIAAVDVVRSDSLTLEARGCSICKTFSQESEPCEIRAS